MSVLASNPVIAPWERMIPVVLELGMLGKEGAITEYVLILPPTSPGQVVIHWRMAKGLRRYKHQAFAVREESGPQCPHCTAAQLFAALGTSLGTDKERMAELYQFYHAVLAQGSRPTYVFECRNGAWAEDCRAAKGDAHTKYDCQKHLSWAGGWRRA
jgi:hypothetical protein